MMKNIIFFSIHLLAMGWYNAQEKIPVIKQDLKPKEIESIECMYPHYKILYKKVDSGFYMQVKTPRMINFSALTDKTRTSYKTLSSPIIRDTIK